VKRRKPSRRRRDATRDALPPAEDPEVDVCGPTSFVESVANALVDWGHPVERIKTERFGPTGPTDR
jgi:ferredoxin-NADP reductase